MAIMYGLSAINAALDAVKTIREIEKDYDAAAMKLAVAQLTESLADAKLAAVDARTNQEDLLSEIVSLKERWKFSGQLVEHRGYKYYADDEGKPTGNAFCQVCERNEQKYFQVTPSKGYMAFTCPNCKSVFHQLSSFL